MRFLSSLVTFIFVFVAFLVVNGQTIDYSVVSSSEEKLRMGQYFDKVIHDNPSFIYTVKRRRINGILEEKKIEVEIYTPDLKRVRSRDLSLEYKGNKRVFEDLLYLNDKLYMFTSFFNTSKKTNFLFVETYDAYTLKKTGSIKILAEFESSNKFEEGFISYEQSFDKSMLMIYSQLTTKRDDNERVHALVFDDEMNLLWEKILELPYKDKSLNVFEYRLSNTGDVYLLCRGLNKEAGFRSGSYIIASFKYGGEDYHEYKLSLDQKLISDLSFIINASGEMIVSGLYSISNIDRMKGVVYYRVDPVEKKLIAYNTSPIDPSILLESLRIRSDKRKDKLMSDEERLKKYELEHFTVRELIPRSDGGVLMITERYFRREYRNLDNGFYAAGSVRTGNSISYSYHYEDIVVYNISSTGVVDWTSRIPKYQSSFNDNGYFLGFTHAVSSDGIYFLFNDNGMSAPQNSDRISFRNSIYSPILYKVGQRGEVTKQSAGRLGNRLLLVPFKSTQTAANRFFIYKSKGSIQQFSVLKL